MAIFLDASVLCAFANTRDVYHKRAMAIIENVVDSKYGEPLFTDYIFDEIMSVILRRTTRNNAIEMGTMLLQSEILMAKVDGSLFQKTWDIFRNVKAFNFTDCSILAFMKTFDIRYLATFDKAFKAVDWLQVIDK